MDYIEISGVKYRVECNFNALVAFADLNGKKDLGFLSEDVLGTKQWMELMCCCINEGERLDGKEHSYDTQFFGACSFADATKIVSKFIEIFAAQTSSDSGGEESKKK